MLSSYDKEEALVLKKIKNLVSFILAYLYVQMYAFAPICYAAKEKADAKSNAAVKKITDGIGIIETIVLAAVGGVGTIFLAWGIFDFATSYSSGNTSEQSQALKKVIGGIIAIAVPLIIAALK